MLSVLIPIYNFNITDLVKELHSQCSSHLESFEIICIDDNSLPQYQKVNAPIFKTLANTSYTQLEKNIGRSKIRNVLAEKAAHRFLLFMDCDSKICSSDYIKNYIEALQMSHSVIYGGRKYDSNQKADENSLHFKFGKEREEIDAIGRKILPYRSFLSNNFVINKNVYNKIKSDETIAGYGYEDAAFAQKLKDNKIHISHIENPLIHLGLETNAVFLQKTANAINNLSLLVINKKITRKQIKVYNYYSFLRIIFFEKVFTYIIKHLEHTIKKNLLSNKPSLFYFDIYKLYLLSLQLNNKKISLP